MRDESRQINFNEYVQATAKTLESQTGLRMQAIVSDPTWPATDDLLEHQDWAAKLEEPYAGRFSREQVKRALARIHFDWELDTDPHSILEHQKVIDDQKDQKEPKVHIDPNYSGRLSAYGADFARIVKTARAANKPIPDVEQLVNLPPEEEVEERKKAIEELLGVPLMEPQQPAQAEQPPAPESAT